MMVGSLLSTHPTTVPSPVKQNSPDTVSKSSRGFFFSSAMRTFSGTSDLHSPEGASPETSYSRVMISPLPFGMVFAARETNITLADPSSRSKLEHVKSEARPIALHSVMVRKSPASDISTSTPLTMSSGLPRLITTWFSEEPGSPEPSPTVRVTADRASSGKQRMKNKKRYVIFKFFSMLHLA